MGVVAFAMGGIQIYTYGILLLGALLLGGAVSYGLVRLYGESLDTFLDFSLFGGIFVLLFSRCFYFMAHPMEFSTGLLSLFSLWQGGFSFSGVLFGMFLFAFFYGRTYGADPWVWLDTMLPIMLFCGFALELGNYLLQWDWGTVYSVNPVAFAGQLVIFCIMTGLAFWEVRRRIRWNAGMLAALGIFLLALWQFAGNVFDFMQPSLLGSMAALSVGVLSLFLLVFRGCESGSRYR